MEFKLLSVVGDLNQRTKSERPEVVQEEISAANVPGGCVIRSVVFKKLINDNIISASAISPVFERVEVVEKEGGGFELQGEVINVTTPTSFLPDDSE